MNYTISIDTSYSICSVAILADDQIVAKKIHDQPNMQAEMLALLTNQVLLVAGIQFANIRAIVVTIGPGSFTGIRIGVAYAHGLHLILKKTKHSSKQCSNISREQDESLPKLIGVTTMQSIAYQVVSANDEKSNEEYIVMLDAGRKSAYMQKFAGLVPANDISLMLENDIRDYANGLAIYGNWMRLSDSVISSLWLQKIMHPTADGAGMYYAKSLPTFMHEPMPIYVREPDATKSSAFN